MVRQEHQTIQAKVITKMDKIPNQTNLQAIQKMTEDKIMIQKILLVMEEIMEMVEENLMSGKIMDGGMEMMMLQVIPSITITLKMISLQVNIMMILLEDS